MKSIITILFSLLIGMMLAGCEDKDTVSVDEPVRVLKVVETPHFTDVNVTEPIYVKDGDYLEFQTWGIWTGVLVFEFSKDGQEWEIYKDAFNYDEEDRFRPYISTNDSNIQFRTWCLPGYVLGLRPNMYYRFNMVAFKGGRCNYSWLKR